MRAGRRIDLKRERIILSPASYELSDAALRLLAPLWEPGSRIDPFFVTLFAERLCEPLPRELIQETRDRSVDAFERALLRSSWAVFLALHLGYMDLSFLKRLRLQVFREIAQGQPLPQNPRSKLGELIRVATLSLKENAPAEPGTLVAAVDLTQDFGRTSRKLASRIQRVESLTDV